MKKCDCDISISQHWLRFANTYLKGYMGKPYLLMNKTLPDKKKFLLVYACVNNACKNMHLNFKSFCSCNL